MTFEIPDDLAPEAYAVSWLLGEWKGRGEITYPNIPTSVFEQHVVFTHDGGPYLKYDSTMTLVGEGDEPGQVWAVESGFWRVAPNAPEGVALQEFQHPLEVIMTDASGVVSVYLGAVGKGRIDIATDAVLRTGTAPAVAGATRMYGLVEGDLMYAWDLAAFGEELQSYAAARLVRTVSGTGRQL